MEVADVLRRCQHLGLRVESDHRHHKVYDPKTGVWLFDVSKSPSDPNWHYNIARYLRRLGLSLIVPKERKKKKKAGSSSVDLVALKKAQEAAAAAGERIPQLSDLDDALPTSPLWQRRMEGNNLVLGEEARQEVIYNMVPKVESSRLSLGRERLRRKLEEYPKSRGAIIDFVRQAQEVGLKRGMQTWKNESSGQQSVGSFLKGESLSLWAFALVEATLDDMEGLRWGIDETRIKQPELKLGDPIPAVVGTPEPAFEISDPQGYLERTDSNRDRYTEVLLTILEKLASDSTEVSLAKMDAIMDRLDRLIME